MNDSRYLAAALLLLAFFPAGARAQMKPGAGARPPSMSAIYDNSATGLRLQLQAILSVTKDPSKVDPLVHELQIPQYEGWFLNNFAPDVELFWAGSYTRALKRAEGSFKSLFGEIGAESGEFKIRKINDAPMSRLEEVLTAKMKSPLDVFAVSWKKQKSAADSDDELLGYYAFIDGRFRWFYMLDFPKNPNANSGSGAASKGAHPADSAGAPKSTPPSKSSTPPTSSQTQ